MVKLCIARKENKILKLVKKVNIELFVFTIFMTLGFILENTKIIY